MADERCETFAGRGSSQGVGFLRGQGIRPAGTQAELPLQDIAEALGRGSS